MKNAFPAFLMSLAAATAVAEPRTKVVGAELEQMVQGYYVTAGFNPGNGCVFITVNHSPTRREVYADCVQQAGLSKGSARIDGERLCTKYEHRDETCTEVHRVGDNQLEVRTGDGRPMRLYRLR